MMSLFACSASLLVLFTIAGKIKVHVVALEFKARKRGKLSMLEVMLFLFL
jgi:hypothetical protein